MYITPWNIEIRDKHGTFIYPKDVLLILRGKYKGKTIKLNNWNIKIEPIIDHGEFYIQVKIASTHGGWMDPDGFELLTPHPDNNSKPR